MFRPLYTRMKQNGMMLNKILIILIILGLYVFSGTGCAGLGDYEIPLHSGYSISRINGSTILLTYDYPDNNGGYIVINDYLIKSYWANENYILVEGFRTNNRTNKEQDPPQEEWIYYVVEVATGNVSDPFETKEALEIACLELDLDISDGWLTPSKP